MRIVRVYNIGVKDGLKSVFSVYGNNLSEESILVSPFGITSKPVTTQKELGVVADTQNNADNIILGLVAKDLIQDLDFGETAIYSVDVFGDPSAVIKLRRDGSIEMGGSSQTQKIGDASSEQVAIAGETDNMVRYSKLEEAFNELKDKYNDLVDKWNTFAAAYVPGGPAIQGTPPAAQPAEPSAADILASKIGNVTTNSSQ